jgi:tRNA-dihydrouridine synthase
VALEHANLYVKFKGERKFYEMRKHLMAYFREFRGAKRLRKKISTVKSLKELEIILNKE